MSTKWTMLRHVLVADGDEAYQATVAFLMMREGYKVSRTRSVDEMLVLLGKEDPDLLLLDLRLSSGDPLALVRDVRKRFGKQVIVMASDREREALIAALGIGCGDFLVKPFYPNDLLLRSRNLLDRPVSWPPEPLSRNRISFVVEGWQVDCAERCLRSPDGREVPLTSKEGLVLRELVRNPDNVVSRQHLSRVLGGENTRPLVRTVDSYISRLRRKLNDDSRHPRVIITVRGLGYKLRRNVPLN